MIRNDIRALDAYHVPDASGLIKLDAMENPYPLPDTLRRTLAERLANADIHRYPDAAMENLREKIAARHGLAPEQILLGNGSDEIIQMLMIAADQGACAAPAPSFVMYELIAKWIRRPFTAISLDEHFNLDADRFLQVVSREKASLAFLACPNNPTGNFWAADVVERIASDFGGLLVIDEAYAPFADRDHLHLINEHVLVLRTFSKIGWAGLRLGYAVGQASLISELNKVRLPYNINTLTQIAADVLLDHFHVFDEQATRIRCERERMQRALAAFPDLQTYPSQTNFITIRVPDAGQAFAHLLKKRILIKQLGGHALLENCLRITIGTPEQNDQVLEALKELFK
ncbi:MAG: histidinol-phosphate transaminase [Zetaproteobacteria bacterium]|nr:MAG: histidinol-phosphate transaminase [Zetaproteobacteria bacterium]